MQYNCFKVLHFIMNLYESYLSFFINFNFTFFVKKFLNEKICTPISKFWREHWIPLPHAGWGHIVELFSIPWSFVGRAWYFDVSS